MTRVIALLLCLTLATAGCAPAAAMRSRSAGLAVAARQTPRQPDPALMSRYVSNVPVGSRVRITLANGKRLQGTLMAHEADNIVVQLRTRLPEPPVDVAIRDIVALELDRSESSLGRVVAIAVGVGAGATLGVLLLIAALLD